MARRKIININQELCNGCGNCVPNCPEGAIQIIDNKARLISDIFCDGLGACIGECPVGAIAIEEREAKPYDEKTVMANIVKQGENTIKAHLKHLWDHGETNYFNQAVQYLNENNISVPDLKGNMNLQTNQSNCPGSRMMDFSDEKNEKEFDEIGKRESQLKQWPIQLHLVPPMAPYYQKKDVLLVADCVGYAIGDFHKDYMKGRSIAIACPKLDDGQDIYLNKITAMVDVANINTLTVMIMEVPCCGGLFALAKKALVKAKREIPLKLVLVSIKGEILEEKWT